MKFKNVRNDLVNFACYLGGDLLVAVNLRHFHGCVTACEMCHGHVVFVFEVLPI